MSQLHQHPTHRRIAPLVTRAANANPHATCWRCGHPLDQHPPHKTGRPPRWTAGHLDHDATPDQRWRFAHHPNVIRIQHLASEASTCNYTAGTTKLNKLKANPRSRHW